MDRGATLSASRAIGEPTPGSLTFVKSSNLTLPSGRSASVTSKNTTLLPRSRAAVTFGSDIGMEVVGVFPWKQTHCCTLTGGINTFRGRGGSAVGRESILLALGRFSMRFDL